LKLRKDIEANQKQRSYNLSDSKNTLTVIQTKKKNGLSLIGLDEGDTTLDMLIGWLSESLRRSVISVVRWMISLSTISSHYQKVAKTTQIIYRYYAGSVTQVRGLGYEI
jgi:hypothetical protein